MICLYKVIIWLLRRYERSVVRSGRFVYGGVSRLRNRSTVRDVGQIKKQSEFYESLNALSAGCQADKLLQQANIL